MSVAQLRRAVCSGGLPMPMAGSMFYTTRYSATCPPSIYLWSRQFPTGRGSNHEEDFVW